ncbi:hypothetical protein Tcan_12037 [Toxocara canis]|uniref:Uncharacterized protein n=1 Tax=Toxocara canis TaxID=6265 RepID=A0A0B2VJ26_TOXCA|nr:hypothetical protein Tcan_12037 [Toxocara canis]
MADDDVDEKCICQLCNCGRHRCPHWDGSPVVSADDTDGVKGSEYNEMYKMKDGGGRAKPFRPEENILKSTSYTPTVNSTSTDDFKAWQVRKPIIVKPNATYEVRFHCSFVLFQIFITQAIGNVGKE